MALLTAFLAPILLDRYITCNVIFVIVKITKKYTD